MKALNDADVGIPRGEPKMGRRYDEVMQSGSTSGRLLWALSTMGFVIIWIGLTFGVGAIGILLVRSYIAFSERVADVLGPDIDTTPAGLAAVVIEVAREPGVHRWMGGIAAALCVSGFVLFMCRLVATWSARRTVAREFQAIADLPQETER